MNIRPSPGPSLSPAVQVLNRLLGKAMGCLLVCGLAFSCVAFSCVGLINSIGGGSRSSSPAASSSDSTSAPASSVSSPSPSTPSSSGASSPSPGSSSTTGTDAPSSGLTPVELRRAAPGMHLLSVRVPASGYARWDVLEQIVWATTIATGWSSEAALERIDVSGVDAVGRVDLTAAEAEAIYRFRAPRPPAPEADDALERNTGRTRPVEGAGGGGVELSIHVLRKTVMAVLKEVEGEDGPRPVSDSVPMRDLFELMERRPGFARAASYDGSLTFDANDGWTWTWRRASGPALRLRARDGQGLAVRTKK